MHYKQAMPHDYDLIMELWSKSVQATHQFVRKEDLEQIHGEIPAYLPHLDVRLWYADNDVCVGFSGVQGHHLEMLFLDPEHTGRGYGTQIMRRLVGEFGVTSVDVNKDNDPAVAFYKKSGFAVIGEEPTDGEGRPYPILHMKRTAGRG